MKPAYKYASVTTLLILVAIQANPAPSDFYPSSAPGTWDSTFRVDSGLQRAWNVYRTPPGPLLIQRDGKILTIRISGLDDPEFTWAGLIRLNQDGSLDSSFNSAVRSFNVPLIRFSDFALDSEGRILVVYEDGLARLNADGSTDNTFAPPTEVVSQPWLRVASLQDGRVLLIGSGVGTKDRSLRILRLNPDGTIFSRATAGLDLQDELFELLSWIALGDEGPARMRFLPNGAILLAAKYLVKYLVREESQAETPLRLLARFTPDGQLDPSFHRPLFGGFLGPWAPRGIRDLAVLPDGRVVVAGYFGAVDGQPRARIARLLADGTVDPTFAPGPWTEDISFQIVEGGPETVSLAVDPQSRVLIGGLSVLNGRAWNLVRLLPDGTLDLTFGFKDLFSIAPAVLTPDENHCGFNEPFVSRISLTPHGKILTSGGYQFLRNCSSGYGFPLPYQYRPFAVRLHGDFQTSDPHFGISRIVFTSEGIGLLLFGPAGSYALESAAALSLSSDWPLIQTVSMEHGSMSVTDDRPDSRSRFYRLRKLNPLTLPLNVHSDAQYP